MAYRTKKEPGDDPGGNRLLGLKVTGPAEIAMNKYEKDAWKVIDKVRGGTTANNGTFTVNGRNATTPRREAKKTRSPGGPTKITPTSKP